MQSSHKAGVAAQIDTDCNDTMGASCGCKKKGVAAQKGGLSRGVLLYYEYVVTLLGRVFSTICLFDFHFAFFSQRRKWTGAEALGLTFSPVPSFGLFVFVT